jgi:hypothetical protein
MLSQKQPLSKGLVVEVKKNYSLIAHGGLHNSSYQRNSLEALELALVKGYGISTEIRLFEDELVIQNEAYDKPLPLSLLLTIWEKTTGLELALKVKMDGLAPLLNEVFSQYSLRNDFFFYGMSTTEELIYENNFLPLAYRLSEREPVIRFNSLPSRIWLDSLTPMELLAVLNEKDRDSVLKQTYLLSLEIYKKDPTDLWEAIKTLKFRGITTEHPQLLSSKLSLTHNYNLGTILPEQDEDTKLNPFS